MLCCALLLLASPMFALWAGLRQAGVRRRASGAGSAAGPCCRREGPRPAARWICNRLGVLAACVAVVVASTHLNHVVALLPADICVSSERLLPIR